MNVEQAFGIPVFSHTIENWSEHKDELIAMLHTEDGDGHQTDYFKYHQFGELPPYAEKLFEVLLSREEMVSASDLGNYFSVSPDNRDLNYGKFYDQGLLEASSLTEYNSHNTARLNIEEMKHLLEKLSVIKAALNGNLLDSEE